MQPGTPVILNGLSTKPELNGAKGVLDSYDEAAGRWKVRCQRAGDTVEIVRVRPANLAIDEAPTAPTNTSIRLKGLIDSLDPGSMMSRDGQKRALVALDVLKTQATEAGTALAMTQVPGSIRILLQTALLHPEASMRLNAMAVIMAFLRQNEPRFLEMAHHSMLSKALARMLAEEDRRVKEDEEAEDGEANVTDPDLPLRRLALEALTLLVLNSTPEAAMRTLEAEDLVFAPLDLLGNSDAEIRRAASRVLLGLLERDDRVATYLRSSLDEVASQAAPLYQKALCDKEPAVRAAVRAALLRLRTSMRLRLAFVTLDAVAGWRTLAAEHEQASGEASATEAAELVMLADWVSGIGVDTQAPRTSSMASHQMVQFVWTPGAEMAPPALAVS